jgi:hypothetical protein
MRTPALVAAVAILVAATSGCSSPGSGATLQSTDAGSCAEVIEMAGIQYIGGRQSDSVLPLTGGPLAAKRLGCDDSGSSHPGTTPIVATQIRGVPVRDAVAAQGHRLMLSERLWRLAWKDLPVRLRPYVARDGA